MMMWLAVLVLAGIGLGLWRMCMEERIDPPEHSFDYPPANVAQLQKCPSGTSKAASWLQSTHDSMHARSHDISSRDTQHSTTAQSVSQQPRYSRSPSPTRCTAPNAAQHEAPPYDAVIAFQRAQHSPHSHDQNAQNGHSAQLPAVSPSNATCASPSNGNAAMKQPDRKWYRHACGRSPPRPSATASNAAESEVTVGCVLRLPTAS